MQNVKIKVKNSSSKLRILIFLLTIFFGFFLFAKASLAACYVSITAGNDANPGTLSAPFRTIQKAADMAQQPGDTIYVRKGTYAERVGLHYSGTASQPITLRNYPGESPIISGQIDLWNINGSNYIISWITIEGLDIAYDNPGKLENYGIIFFNATDVTIRHNIIRDHGMGILGNGLRVHIDGNMIVHNGDFQTCQTDPSVCNQDHGIYCTGTYFTITNNLIYNNLANGVQVAGYPLSPDARYYSWDYAGARHWLIANNVFAFQHYRDGICVWQPDASDNVIENNIFYENHQEPDTGDGHGISFYGSGGNNLVRNNLFYSSQRIPAIADTANGASYATSNNLDGSNPQFLNPSTISPDFHLKSGSPAINAGVALSEVTTDYDGVSRPQGSAYDIGAYEYTGTPPDTTPPAPPTGVRIR